MSSHVLGPPAQCQKPFQLPAAETPCSDLDAVSDLRSASHDEAASAKARLVSGPFVPLDGGFRLSLTHSRPFRRASWANVARGRRLVGPTAARVPSTCSPNGSGGATRSRAKAEVIPLSVLQV